MIKIDETLRAVDLKPQVEALWAASRVKLESIETEVDVSMGAPVFTEDGRYTSRGWTEWTQGFQYGSLLLQFDATDDAWSWQAGREGTHSRMAPHVSHVGVHDHGFNNVSTYGNMLRLAREGRVPMDEGDIRFLEMALKVSGAVQADRWTDLPDDLGYVYSFNGPHSLFADTIRSMRALMVSHGLGHELCGENDRRSSLLKRAIQHMATTARYTVFYGEGRDAYDLRGRVTHECVFNTNDGCFRCPNSQQGYSPFTTWTRGLAWVMLGYAEELEFLATRSDEELEGVGGRKPLVDMMLKAATASCDFYIEHTPTDGLPYWDTGAPGLALMGDYLDRPAEPFNDHEPVDSSAAAIAAQGLLRLGRYLGETDAGRRYTQAGLTVLQTLFAAPYLDTTEEHQGLILHSIYHRPNGWDFVPSGQTIPCGESSMWGDYHAREAALLVQRRYEDKPYLTFFGCLSEKG